MVRTAEWLGASAIARRTSAALASSSRSRISKISRSRRGRESIIGQPHLLQLVTCHICSGRQADFVAAA
jgi:hypothetical protein